MKKQITCPHCGGLGFHMKFEENNGTVGSWNELCKTCGGKAYVEVAMTNGDRIRAMSDEELASEMSPPAILTICDIVCQGECNAMATLDKTSGEVCKEIILNWLRQPAEEDA